MHGDLATNSLPTSEDSWVHVPSTSSAIIKPWFKKKIKQNNRDKNHYKSLAFCLFVFVFQLQYWISLFHILAELSVSKGIKQTLLIESCWYLVVNAIPSWQCGSSFATRFLSFIILRSKWTILTVSCGSSVTQSGPCDLGAWVEIVRSGL